MGFEARGAAPWPLPHLPVAALAPADLQQITDLADALRAGDAGLRDQADFGALVSAGWQPGPTLYLEDHREIEFEPEAAALRFEYRSLALAGDGDLLLLSRPREPAFEAWLAARGLGAPEVLSVPGPQQWDAAAAAAQRWSLAAACRRHAPTMQRLVAAARAAGGINILPYVSSGAVWLLAAALAREAGVPVRVAAAPPRLSRLANDKLWFAQQVRALLGPAALPPTYSVFSASAAAARLRWLARHHEQVVLKTLSSSGSMGNLRFDSADCRDRSLAELRSQIVDALHALGWHERFPLLVGVWEGAVISSPSAQLWVPAATDGPPLLQGIFVQILQGRGGQFVGGEPAELPPALQQHFAREALQLATLLQHLGYFGRLSFDALLLGTSPEQAQLHWIECNARWGGTSIPMTVAHRLGFRPGQGSLVIAQKALRTAGPGLPSFQHLIQGCHKQVVWLTPAGGTEPIATLFAMAPTTPEARRLALDTPAARLGSG